MRVFLFPGQGSQAVGMGKALADNFTLAKDVFAEVDDALNQKLSTIMWEGPEADLTLTENTQPAIMACSIAAQRVLEAEAGITIAGAGNYVAGHSLGEYSALTAAGALGLADCAKLLKIRGEAMQAAVPAGKGAMAAIIGLEIDVVEAVAKEAQGRGEICQVANHNSETQIVISGTAGGIEKACEIAKERGAKRALPLAVSAPFHSPMMQPAAQRMREALDEATVNAPVVPVIANVTAEPTQVPEAIRALLVDQVCGMVRWHDSMVSLPELGISQAIECGHGKVLSGMLKRTCPAIALSNIGAPDDLTGFEKAAA